VPEGFTDLVGCEFPLEQAPLGGPIATPQLAAAVSEAGGLGTIANPSSAEEVSERLSQARQLTTRPLGVGFLVPFIGHDAVEAAAQAANVVEFFYGEPDPELVTSARGHGAVAGWQVGSVTEAVTAVEAGCDYVIAQGVEAGGHVRGTEGLDRLLEDTLDAVEVPVVAAGGVGTPERLQELLAAGASAVRVGTRFIAAEESGAHPEYVSLLISAGREDTVLTESFAAGWPDAPHRVLRSAVEAAGRFEGEVVGLLGDREISPWAALPPTREITGQVSAMALYAGESVDAVTRVQPAAEIVAELTAGL
jgi:NAD(P)H-dependent flavin oxidoreductase YrpB (nitropropane dioxygenase family)